MARNVALPRDELDLLLRLQSDVSVTPVPGTADTYDLKPGSKVGVISLGERDLVIRPKIGFDRTLFLISYALDRGQWRGEEVSLARQGHIVEAVKLAFAAQLRRAIGRGVLRGYRSEEDALPTVRGRIRFGDQLRRRPGILLPVELSFDEFTEDIEENRILRAALDRLRRVPSRSTAARVALRPHEAALAEVNLVEYDSRSVPQIRYSRLNAHYRTAVELARLILMWTSYELRGGEVSAAAFLIDMNKVFEDFVVVALREALGLSAATFPQNARGRRVYLSDQDRIRLEPDLSWWGDDGCEFVGDVKYKRTNVEGIVHADLYQLFAYTTALNLPRGTLIYAAGIEVPTAHRVAYAGKRLQVRELDLSGEPTEILSAVGELAAVIREERALSAPDRRTIVAAR